MMEFDGIAIGEMKPYAEYNGVKIFSLSSLSSPVDATVSYSKTRITFAGKIGVDRTEGSYKFGDEILIALWTKELPKINDRCSQKGFSRIQINLSLKDAISLFKNALEKLEDLKESKKKALSDFM